MLPFLDHPGPIALAHRGGALDGCENSMAAFERAVRMGYRYLETDVHATRDGVLVAFHDDTLDRVTDGTGRVGELPWSRVRQARIGGREPIPRLVEVLDAWPDVRVNVDPKSDEAVDPLVAAVRRAGALDRVCVGSFSGRRLARVRAALGPRLCTSMAPAEVVRLRLAAWARAPVRSLPARLVPGGGACVQVPVRQGRVRLVDATLLGLAHALGLPVHVWTVNQAAAARALLDEGVDGIVTDDLGMLRAVLQERAEW